VHLSDDKRLIDGIKRMRSRVEAFVIANPLGCLRQFSALSGTGAGSLEISIDRTACEHNHNEKHEPRKDLLNYFNFFVSQFIDS